MNWRWLIANVLGWGIGLPLAVLTVRLGGLIAGGAGVYLFAYLAQPTEPDVWLWLGRVLLLAADGTVLGAAVGVAQWAALDPDTSWQRWALTTAGGYALGFAASTLLGVPPLTEATYALTLAPNQTALGGLLPGIAIGIASGLAQWQFLPLEWGWAVATAAGIALGFAVAGLFTWWVLAGAAVGAVLGGATGTWMLNTR